MTQLTHNPQRCFTVEELRQAGKNLKANSQQAFDQDLKRFLNAGYGLMCTSRELEQYLVDSAQGLNGRALSPRSLERFLSSFRKAYRTLPSLKRLPDPSDSENVRHTLAGIRSRFSRPESQAPHIPIDTLRLLYDHLNQLTTEGDTDAIKMAAMRDCALLACGFWRGLRADTLSALRASGIKAGSRGTLTIRLPKEKQLRDHRGRDISLEPWPLLEPTQPLKRWLKQLPANDDTALFPGIHRSGKVPYPEIGMGRKSIGQLLKKRLSELGIEDAGVVSAHSLRHSLGYWGGSHLDINVLMEQGGWKSVQSVARYIGDNRRILSLHAAVENEIQQDKLKSNVLLTDQQPK